MKFLTLILLALLLPSRVFAGALENAGTAFNHRDYQTAFQLTKPLADQGNPKAQFAIGVMYEHGNGVVQDFAEAVKWYHKAAEQGHLQAQEFLGLMYFNGHGVPQNDAEAFNWYQKAARQGDAISQRNLGWLYMQGRGVKQDFVEAAFWLTLASQATPAIDMKGWDVEVADKITSEQTNAVNKRVREWKPPYVWSSDENPYEP